MAFMDANVAETANVLVATATTIVIIQPTIAKATHRVEKP